MFVDEEEINGINVMDGKSALPERGNVEKSPSPNGGLLLKPASNNGTGLVGNFGP